MDSIVFPELDCPFPRVVNVHADAVHRGSVEWVRRFRLIPGKHNLGLFDAIGIGRLVARTHPESPLDDLQLISDWHAWLFILDDVRDDSDVNRDPKTLSNMDNRFLDILEGGNPNKRDIPLVLALQELRSRLGEYVRARKLSGVWLRRFIRTIKDSFEVSLWEADNRARGVTPGIESYLRMRRLAGGLSIITELTEIIEGIHLPHEVREHPTVRRLTDASDNVICWANDILSLDKELEHDEVNNLVVVLCAIEGLTLQQAVDQAADMYEDEMDVFVGLEQNLPSFGLALDAALERYISLLHARIRGVIDWTYESVRYRAALESDAKREASPPSWHPPAPR